MTCNLPGSPSTRLSPGVWLFYESMNKQRHLEKYPLASPVGALAGSAGGLLEQLPHDMTTNSEWTKTTDKRPVRPQGAGDSTILLRALSFRLHANYLTEGSSEPFPSPF